jgi:Zn-finger nucleic acid-binding protein
MAANEKDKFGETMKLVERAKEDIYFAQRDREILEKLRGELKKIEQPAKELACPKCGGTWENYSFQSFTLDRCRSCEGIWMDKGELESVLRRLARGPLGAWIDKLVGKG